MFTIVTMFLKGSTSWVTLILHCPKNNLNVFVKKTEPVTVGAEATDYIHGFCARQIYCKQKPDIYRCRCQRSKRDMPGFHAKILIITLRIEGHFYKKKTPTPCQLCPGHCWHTIFANSIFAKTKNCVQRIQLFCSKQNIVFPPFFRSYTLCIYTNGNAVRI